MRAPAAGPQATSHVTCHISFERGDFDFPPLKWPCDLPFLRSCSLQMVLRWSSCEIAKIDHLGKGLELRSATSRGSQNPRVAKVMMI